MGDPQPESDGAAPAGDEEDTGVIGRVKAARPLHPCAGQTKQPNLSNKKWGKSTGFLGHRTWSAAALQCLKVFDCGL